MLGKLIKHDFKSLSRVLIPTNLAILGATIIMTMGIAFNVKESVNSAVQNSSMTLLRVITVLMSVTMGIAIFAALFLVAFIIFQRFYKSFMSDEGYLTFTLPVTTTQLLWSKLITAMLWTIISSVAIFICFNIFILFGTASTGIVNTWIYSEAAKEIHEFILDGARLTVPIIEFIVLSIVSTAKSILHVYLAIIIGGIVSQKHKILFAILFFFAISIALTTLTSIAQYFLGTGFAYSMEFNGVMNPTDAAEAFNYFVSVGQPYFWFYFVFTLAITATFFVLSRYFLKNKLNLD